MKKVTIKDCIKAVEMFNEGTMTEGEMLHILTDYDRCHKNSILYDIKLGKVVRLYLVDENIIMVKTVWRHSWADEYITPTKSEVVQYIESLGREVRSDTYALMYEEIFKMLDTYNDTHKLHLYLHINGIDYIEYSDVHMTLYQTRREGDRKRTDQIMHLRVKVV